MTDHDFRSTHPSGKISPSTKTWTGIEVEGRHMGLPVCMIAEPLQGEEGKSVEAWILDRALATDGHGGVVFLTETFPDHPVAWLWLSGVYVRLREALSRSRSATDIQYTRIKWVCGRMAGGQAEHFLKVLRPMVPFVRVIVRYLDTPWALDMTVDDQISFGVPYNLFTLSLQHAIRSHPDDYIKDVPK